MRNSFQRTLLVLLVCASVTCTRKDEKAEVSPEEETQSTETSGAETKPFEGTTNSIGMKMVLIPPGEFVMGSPRDEKKRGDKEGPQHRVRITKPFYLGIYEVTQAEYARVMGRNPSHFCASGVEKAKVAGLKTARFPVEAVTWYDAVEFCNRLSEREGLPAYYRLSGVRRDCLTKCERGFREPKGEICIVSATVEVLGGPGYRLPSEAEWEYACRAGTTTPFSFGEVLNGRQANCDGRSYPYGTEERGRCLARPAVVGSYPPSAFGLYDMHGNVEEWCADFSDFSYYRSSPTEDPPGPSSGDELEDRVVRGGACTFTADRLRAAYRSRCQPGERIGLIGFRVARTAEQSQPANAENHADSARYR